MVPLGKFTTKLFGSINGGAYLASNFALRVCKRGDDIPHRNVFSDNHYVHVAARVFPAGCD